MEDDYVGLELMRFNSNWFYGENLSRSWKKHCEERLSLYLFLEEELGFEGKKKVVLELETFNEIIKQFSWRRTLLLQSLEVKCQFATIIITTNIYN